MATFKKGPKCYVFCTDAPHMASLVFAPPKEVEAVSSIHTALEVSTWGESRALMPKSGYEAFLDRRRDEAMIEDEEVLELPGDDGPFAACDWFPEWTGGYYPDWLQTRQHEWIPTRILDAYGEEEMSVINGLFWIIGLDREQGTVSALRAEGYEVKRRDDLRFR